MSVTEFGIREFGIPNFQTQKLEMVQIKLKLKKKTKEEDKKKEVSIYKSTFNAINNIIFVTIICFD